MSGIFAAGDLSFATVTRESNLREQVSAALRAALISGRMRPGITYSAPVLGEMLGVSATPVREAMLDLVREGLVEVARNKGFRVTEVSERELDELAETRSLLEVPIMGAVAESDGLANQEAFDRLRRMARELEDSAKADDLVSFMRLDTEFHTEFLALHGNREVVNLVRNLRSRSRLYGLEKLARAGALVETAHEHAKMIELAVNRDRDGLEALTRQHIGHVRTVWASGAEEPQTRTVPPVRSQPG
jgi:DNA-binding GntR family transcriptional regulator